MAGEITQRRLNASAAADAAGGSGVVCWPEGFFCPYFFMAHFCVLSLISRLPYFPLLAVHSPVIRLPRPLSIHHDAMVLSPRRVPHTRHKKEQNDVDTQSAKKTKKIT